MHSNRYTFIYATVISVVTAVLLAFSAEGLKPFQDANVAFEKKSNILSAVRVSSPDRALIEKTYADQVKELVLDGKGTELSGVSPNDVVLKEEVAKQPEARQLPLYVYTGEGGRKYYIIPMQGVGLWGPIWGYVSLEDDFNTVYGAFFDHKSETPGLGAEISEKPFQEQFQGKKNHGRPKQFYFRTRGQKSGQGQCGRRTPGGRHIRRNHYLPGHGQHVEELRGTIFDLFWENDK